MLDEEEEDVEECEEEEEEEEVDSAEAAAGEEEGGLVAVEVGDSLEEVQGNKLLNQFCISFFPSYTLLLF